MTAREITANLLLEIPKQFPGSRAWRRNVGTAVAGDRFIRFGQKGEADITGILKPHGVWLAIEVKAGKDRLTPEQASFLAMVTDAGGIAMVARDVDGAIAELKQIWETRKS